MYQYSSYIFIVKVTINFVYPVSKYNPTGTVQVFSWNSWSLPHVSPDKIFAVAFLKVKININYLKSLIDTAKAS